MSARKRYFLLSLAILAVDQATKIAADAFLRARGPVEIVPGFFNLWYSRNRGGLFGYFQGLPDPWRVLLLTLLPVVVVAGIAWYLAKTRDTGRLQLGGLALILGGAVGNLVDRVFRGEVIDFLDVYASSPVIEEHLVERFGTAHWPTFNVADSAIVAGACLLVLDVLRPAPRPEALVDRGSGAEGPPLEP
jgi:signal peptidase II